MITEQRSDIAKTIQDLKTRVEGFRSGLMKLIEELPDNPRIKRLGSSGCFTMSVRDTFQALKVGEYKDGKEKRKLISNWCPEFHDFKRQYQRIAQIINKERFETIISTVEKIIKEEKWFYPGTLRTSGWTFQFHPEVVSHLKSLWSSTRS